MWQQKGSLSGIKDQILGQEVSDRGGQMWERKDKKYSK